MKYPSNAEIKSHELLTDDQRKMCLIMRDTSINSQRPFTMLTFAKIALGATARDLILNDHNSDHEVFLAEIAHRKAAILFVHEALKACDKKWSHFDEMLKNLVMLEGDMP